jgi:hypothetical protein
MRTGTETDKMRSWRPIDIDAICTECGKKLEVTRTALLGRLLNVHVKPCECVRPHNPYKGFDKALKKMKDG